jgi:hypothetical protein
MANPIQQSLNTNMTTTDFSVVVGTTPITLFVNPALTGRQLNFMRIWNISASATIWLSRAGTATVNTAGSYPLLPGTYEAFANPQSVPNNPLSIVASAANTPVTIEVG